MSTAYIAVAATTAAANLAAALANFLRAGWIMTNMSRYGVPHGWISFLGVAKAAGAVGLLIGIAVPALGLLAAAGLVLYYVGAVITVVRARWWSHLPFPALYLGAAVASLALAG